MFSELGFSVYISQFEEQKKSLSKLFRKDAWVFTSFHISEEIDSTYTQKAYSMCTYLRDIGYKIIADVSHRTLEIFDDKNFVEFANRMGISMLRIDFGLSIEQICSIGEQLPICINASTIELENVILLKQKVKQLYAMHNFYPRPETGLDVDFFYERNLIFQNLEIPILTFISGNLGLRGPLFLGLPTLEKHRKELPYPAFVDIYINFSTMGIFIGDGIITQEEADRISFFLNTGIIDLPVQFENKFTHLLNKIFTIRVDSPEYVNIVVGFFDINYATSTRA